KKEKTMTAIRIPRPDDWHVHLREGSLLRGVIRETALVYRRALVMPNIGSLHSAVLPGVITAMDVLEYRGMIRQAVGITPFEPLMTVKIVPQTTPDMVRAAKYIGGAIAGKLYP